VCRMRCMHGCACPILTCGWVLHPNKPGSRRSKPCACAGTHTHTHTHTRARAWLLGSRCVFLLASYGLGVQPSGSVDRVAGSMEDAGTRLSACNDFCLPVCEKRGCESCACKRNLLWRAAVHAARGGMRSNTSLALPAGASLMKRVTTCTTGSGCTGISTHWRCPRGPAR